MTEARAQSHFTLFDALPSNDDLSAAWAAAANLALTGGFLWLVAQGAFQFRLTPQALAIEAAGGACLAFLCSLGAGAALRAMAPFRDGEHYAANARGTAVAAVWLSPAAILLAHASPAAFVAAPIPAIIASRLLCQLRREEVSDPKSELSSVTAAGLFGQYSPEMQTGRLRSSVIAAAAVQAAFCALLLRHEQLGAIFGATGAAIVTLIAISRSERPVYPPRGKRRPALQIAANISLATLLTIAGLAVHVEYRDRNAGGGTEGGRARGAAGLPGSILNKLSAQRVSAAEGRQETPAYGLGGTYPGVVLWPEVKPFTVLIAPAPRGIGWGAMRHPFHIPFGGEYWMYRAPWPRPPAGSYFRRSTPATQVFHTSDGLPLEMEARQKLEQPIDMQCCSEIQLEIWNAEPDADGLSVELMLRDEGRSSMWQSLGRREVLSKPRSTHSPVGESLAFPLISDPQLTRFNEFRVVFHRGPKLADKSVRVAIERFVLIPK